MNILPGRAAWRLLVVPQKQETSRIILDQQLVYSAIHWLETLQWIVTEQVMVWFVKKESSTEVHWKSSF